MATASPTPMATAGAVRRTSQRQALRRPASRQMVSRSESQAAAAVAPASQSPHQQQYHDDSSEDEIPVPMKLSALTKALLNDDAPEPANKEASPPRTRRRTSALNNNSSSAGVVGAGPQDRRHLRSGSVQPADDKPAKAADTSQNQEASPVRKRVVRLGSNPHSLNQMGPGKRRSTSMSRSTGPKAAVSLPSRTSNNHEKPAEEEQEPQPEPQPEVNTPPHPDRVVRIAAGSSANRSRVSSSGPSSGRSKFDRSVADRSHLEAEYDQPEAPESAVRNSGSHGSASRYPSTRSRPDDVNPQSSMRVKRVGKLSGSFLSGPARRGRRRQSDEEGEGHVDGDHAVPSHEAEHGLQPADEPPEPSVYHEANRDFNSGSPVSGSAAARASNRRQASGIELPDLGSSRRSSRGVQFEARRDDHITVPEAMLPKRIEIPSINDQENEYLITFKRPVKVAADLGVEKPSIRPLHVDLGSAKAASPERKPLASIANNTPHRSAPPPPKMSVLEAATSTAGAATTTQARQRRNVLRVNGKCYTRLECLGRGGSAKVYRVTAENGKMFALKRVSLENADESIIKGYRGEIDLLGKLKGVDRVIDLYDHELNSEKQVLTLVGVPDLESSR